MIMANYMNAHDFQKVDEINDKDKSISTTSFYRNPARYKNMHRSNSLLVNQVQFQERETTEGIDKLRLTLNSRSEYITKRAEQSSGENKKIMGELVEAEKEVNEKLKNAYKKDNTKEWSLEMEKTIQGIISSTNENEKKYSYKYVQKCKTLEQRCGECEEKVRQQRKEREKQWQEVINNIGGTIIKAQQVIGGERQEMQDRLLELQKQILDIDDQVAMAIQNEKAIRKKQHEFMSKLIERIMDKLIS